MNDELIFIDAGTRPPIEVVDRFGALRPKVDVLFVVDNSSSMGEEQQLVASSFSGFVDAFECGH